MAQGRLRPVELKGGRRSVLLPRSSAADAPARPHWFEATALATPAMAAVPLIPGTGGAAADRLDQLQCGRHREFAAQPPPTATAAERPSAKPQRNWTYPDLTDTVGPNFLLAELSLAVAGTAVLALSCRCVRKRRNDRQINHPEQPSAQAGLPPHQRHARSFPADPATAASRRISTSAAQA